MLKIFRHYSLKQRIIMICNILLYLGFVYLLINAALTEKGQVASYAFIVLGIIALVIGVLNEYLKIQYNEALWHLNFKLDPDKASQIYDNLVRKDIFKVYQNNRGLFDIMVALEKKQPKKVLELINENEKKLNSNVEMMLIRLYYEIRANLMLGNSKKVNELYMDVENIEKMKKKPKIFQFDEFHALKQLALKNRGRAYDCFKNVNMKNMNPKEQLFILNNLIELGPRKEADEYAQIRDDLLVTIDESK